VRKPAGQKSVKNIQNDTQQKLPAVKTAHATYINQAPEIALEID
jgi:hypothetical protein